MRVQLIRTHVYMYTQHTHTHTHTHTHDVIGNDIKSQIVALFTDIDNVCHILSKELYIGLSLDFQFCEVIQRLHGVSSFSAVFVGLCMCSLDC